MPATSNTSRCFVFALLLAIPAVALLLLVSPVSSFEAASGGKPSPPAAAQSESQQKALTRIDAEQEKEALAFVREHHADLARLLPQLKRGSPKEYQEAIHDLHRASQRLASRKERNPRRYELELEAWKVQSRIDLLMARLSMSYSEKLVAELREALQDEAEIRRAMLADDHERALARARQLENMLVEAKEKDNEQVEQELQRLLRRMGHRPATKGEPQPAKQTKNESPAKKGGE